MLAEDARKIAETYAVESGIEVSRFHSIQLFRSEENQPNEWIVRFELITPEDVLSGPELVLIEVNDETGDVSVMESL